MNTVIKQIKRCFTIYSALFITLITTRVRGHQHCGHEQLVQCSKPLSVITDSGLTFVSSKSDLDRICPDLKEALKCIHGYTRRCMTITHRKHFKQLFHGTGAMVHELCNNNTYQEEYLKYAPCMKEVAADNKICFSRYSDAMKDVHNRSPVQNESSPDIIAYPKRKREAAEQGIKSVCCSFQEYVECSTHTMRRACGEEAALFSRSFLDRMSSSMIKMHCSEYGAQQCGIISVASTNNLSLFSLGTAILVLLKYSFS